MSIFAELADFLRPIPFPFGDPIMTDATLSSVLASTDKAIEARTEPSTAVTAAVATALATPPTAPAAAPYSTHTMTMLRQLDEQRQHFHEVADELDAEIAALTQKRDDALHAAAMAEAGMQAMENANG